MALAHTVSDKVEAAAYRRGDMREKRRRLMDDWATYCGGPRAGFVGDETIRMVGSWNPAHHPKLTDSNCIVTSRVTKSYNCIAWAATGSMDAPWWWPVLSSYFWPEGVPREVTIPAFLLAFSTVGFVECADGMLEAGFEKVALYGNRMPWGTVEPTHASRQLPDGKWTSKLGNLEDITHTNEDDVNGPIYGGVVHYLKRPKA